MSRGDQGGCCIAMYAGTPTFPSKTQHIMSRYRPIAPKPLAPKPDGADPSDPQTSSSLSLDKGSSKLSGTKGRRSRKRQTDSSSGSTRNAKKVSRASEKRLNGTTGKTPVTATSKRNESGSPNDKEVPVELTPILSKSVAPVFGPGGLQRFNESTDRSGNSFWSLPTRSLANDENTSYGVGENRLVKLALPGDSGLLEVPLRETAIETDSAFMTRAAESSPVWRGEGSGSGMSNQLLGGFSGGFGEMFKGLPPAQVTMPDLKMQTLSSAPSKETDPTMMRSNEPLRGTFLPLPYASASYGAESEVCSADDVAESRRTNLVTLSLLPDTPLNGPSSPSDSSFPRPSQAKSKSSLPRFSTHGLRFDFDNAVTDQVVADTNLTMFSTGEWREEECRDSTGKKELTNSQKSEGTLLTDGLGPVASKDFVERVTGSAHATIHCPGGSDKRGLNVPVVDSYHLDQVYATSSDAVMLTDEQTRILWSNSAFRRAATEKTSGKMQSAGPHIDPLGIPTQLAVVMFQPPYHAPKCTAVLWGFLKKFIFQEAGPCFADSEGLGQWKFSQAQCGGQSYDSRTVSFDTSMVLKDSSVVYEGDLSLGLSPHIVTVPQPVQAVGSTICLESITKVNRLASPMLGTVEAFQDQLEKLLLPTIITDLRHEVRWVNTAYKQMVGQPEFAWLTSTVGGNMELEAPSQTRLAGDVSFVCAGEQPPVDAAEFSCKIRIQWTKGGGGNSSLVCPVDVIRLDEDSSGPLFVWKFDIFNGQPPLRLEQ